MLHPRHKLAYFKSAGWEDSWIKTAKNLIRDRFESDYSDTETTAASANRSIIEDVVQQVRKLVITYSKSL